MSEYYPRNGGLLLPDGSARSDEGYHSNGCHDDASTPPEDSDSDSDNNYVLDFSVKDRSKSSDSERSGDDQSNDFRRVKMKMHLTGVLQRSSRSSSSPPRKSSSSSSLLIQRSPPMRASTDHLLSIHHRHHHLDHLHHLLVSNIIIAHNFF